MWARTEGCGASPKNSSWHSNLDKEGSAVTRPPLLNWPHKAVLRIFYKVGTNLWGIARITLEPPLTWQEGAGQRS